MIKIAAIDWNIENYAETTTRRDYRISISLLFTYRLTLFLPDIN